MGGAEVQGAEVQGAERVTMAFLFTDIVGSTALWERYPEAMPSALRRHDALLEDAVSCHDGVVVHRAGDGMIASFPTVAAAADAAVTAQLGLIDADWSDVGELGVRMGVHVGPVVVRDGNPYGWALNFGARFSDVGSAGQILVSGAALAELGTLAQMSLVSIRHRTTGPMAAAPILLDLLEVLIGVGHRTHLWSSLRLASVVLADLGDDDLAVQVAAWVRNVGLAMPAFASEQELLDATAERILADRGAEWVGRMELMSSTWTPSTATTLVRDALARHLDVP